MIFIFYSISNFAFTDFYKRLDLRRKLAAEQMLNEDPRDGNFKWTYEHVENLDNQHNFIVEFDQENNILYNNGLDLKLWDNLNKKSNANFKIASKFYSTDVYKKDGRMYIIGVSAENYFYTHHIAYLRNLLFISLVLGVLFVTVVSLLVKRSFLRPINGIINEVEKIGSENLFLRLRETEDKSVLNKLAMTFNRMLARIETSFETQKNFISNASHELNTPLTSIIGTADLALSKERSIEEYQQSLTKIITSADNLEKKTNALLLLARTGYENNGSNFKPVRIDQIIMDADLTVKAINERFHIKTDFTMLPEDSMKLKVIGSSALLQLAFSNIISNACKYSANHTAYVALGALEDSVIVLIKDEGIGIPEQDIPYIFDPYFRASNTGNFSGYGIGLPLARNIIRMHNGKLNVSSVLAEGTTVRIEFPTISSF
ncbi:sensor histidine kinase [Sphingobacterium pedocola]|uniref:sensor histidine kinase n=1 Tax=Sphingobacterium pedocola TaxID=2082722 RepID=UPI001E3BC127|nr:HAMP domain-containing sensor histidine kinase [Sphingobacterium pedocola]